MRRITKSILCDYRKAHGNHEKPINSNYAIEYVSLEFLREKYGKNILGVCLQRSKRIMVAADTDNVDEILVHELTHSFQQLIIKTAADRVNYERGYWENPYEIEAFSVERLFKLWKRSQYLYERTLQVQAWIDSADKIAAAFDNYESRYRFCTRGQRRAIRKAIQERI